MAGSTINGNAGAANSGAIVAAQPVDARGALTGVVIGLGTGALTGTPQRAVVGADGSYSFTSLPAGTYNLDILPPGSNPASAPQPLIPKPVFYQSFITVDGSSTYAI